MERSTVRNPSDCSLKFAQGGQMSTFANGCSPHDNSGKVSEAPSAPKGLLHPDQVDPLDYHLAPIDPRITHRYFILLEWKQRAYRYLGSQCYQFCHFDVT